MKEDSHRNGVSMIKKYSGKNNLTLFSAGQLVDSSNKQELHCVHLKEHDPLQ